MFLRCAKGKVCDLLLAILVYDMAAERIVRVVLDEVEDGHSIAHWREQTGAIRREDEIASAVDGAEKVRKL